MPTSEDPDIRIIDTAQIARRALHLLFDHGQRPMPHPHSTVFTLTESTNFRQSEMFQRNSLHLPSLP